MGDQATFGIAITASDKTDKGLKSAEKRATGTVKRVGDLSRRSMVDGERAIGKSGTGILRTFASVEKAGSKIFGGGSATSGITRRLGAVREAASAAGEGMGEAATAGSALEGALGGVGIIAGATVGILVAAGVAGYKLADSWVKGAAAIGRTAQTIGVATKALQEFQAAGERAGVDKTASTGALGGIAQTLNDARYGRNNDALALMLKLGMRFKYGADGQIDTTAMTMTLADEIAKQPNAQSRRKLASVFGISDAALPMFLQGSGQLKADMADADAHAAVMSDGEVGRGQRIYRKGVIASQMKDRAMMRLGEGAAYPVEGVYDGVISGGRAIMDGGSTFDRSVHTEFVPASRRIDEAARRIERASVGAGGSQVAAQARRGARLRDKLIASGFSRADADALAANAVRESGADYTRHEILPNGKRGPGYGLWQWTNGKRKADFERLFGHSIYSSTEDEQISFLRWELGHTETRGWGMAHQNAQRPGEIARGFALGVERMRDKTGEPVARGDVADALDKIPVHVTVDIKGGGHGTRATVKAGRSPRPAVSHAFVFDPVHGG